MPKTQTLVQAFGGPLLKNSHAREVRPFTRQADLHLCLQARALPLKRNFWRPDKKRGIHIILRRQARRHSVKLKWFSIEANRIQIVVTTKQRKNVSNFLRSICGLIARRVLEIEKGSGKLKSKSLWVGRPL